MRQGVIDGDRWIKARLALLRDRLREDLSADERRAIEAEVETLQNERGIHHGGPRPLWLSRGLVTRVGRLITRRSS